MDHEATHLDLTVLSIREREVLAAAMRGGSVRSLADELSVSESTVRTHLAHIYTKLGVAGRIELLARAQGASESTAPSPGAATTRSRRARRVVWAAATSAVAVALTVVAALALGGTSRFSDGGIAFDYPSGWSVHSQLPRSTGFGQVVAILGTLPWGPCEASDLNCHYQEHLGSAEIEVEVGVSRLQVADGICGWALTRPDLSPRSDGPAVAGTRYLRVLGRPTILTDWSVNGTDYYGSDGWREWLIAAPGSTATVYRIAAKWHGPGDEAMLHGLDQVIRTLKLSSIALPSYGQSDCGEPFPVAAASP